MMTGSDIQCFFPILLNQQAAFTHQAKSDLQHFLRLRAAETISGGALVAHLIISPSDAPEQGYRVLNDVAQVGAHSLT